MNQTNGEYRYVESYELIKSYHLAFSNEGIDDLYTMLDGTSGRYQKQ